MYDKCISVNQDIIKKLIYFSRSNHKLIDYIILFYLEFLFLYTMCLAYNKWKPKDSVSLKVLNITAEQYKLIINIETLWPRSDSSPMACH